MINPINYVLVPRRATVTRPDLRVADNGTEPEDGRGGRHVGEGGGVSGGTEGSWGGSGLLFGGGHFFFDRTGQGQGRPRRTGAGGIGSADRQPHPSPRPTWALLCLTGTTSPSQRFDDGTQGSNGDSITCTLSLSPILLCACLRACLFIASLFLVVLFRDILAPRLTLGCRPMFLSPHLAVSRHRHLPKLPKGLKRSPGHEARG